STQALLAASDDVRRGDSATHPVGLGYFLQPEVHLDAVPVHQIHARPPGVCVDLQNLSPDVRGYRDCHRQRPRLTIGPLGAMAGQTMSTSVRRGADARPQTAGDMEFTTRRAAD